MPRTKTIAELRAELAAKEKQLAGLRAKRAGLAKQLDKIDQQIAALGGTGRRGPRKAPTKPVARRTMPKNVKPLIEYVREALAEAKGGMRVKDIMAAVQKAGYKTNSKDFYGVVATAVREGGFQKLSRGVYKLGGPKKPVRKMARKAAKKEATPKAKG
ncbi:MAG TPA: hypothetical protein VMY37_21540 [Thermoguttaceae bacterium]|nr:hypothetical protein [Thermoguttaceae bacterium]